MTKPLTDLRQNFILHWGEMGSKWGINRSMGQIHGLLLTSEEPLTAEEISECLGIARSNVSTSLRELQGWGIVKIQHQVGDRRDHFVTEQDPWILFRTIARERLRREVMPTMDLLNKTEKVAKTDPDHFTVQQMKSLGEFFEMSLSWFDMCDALPTPALKAFLKTGPSLGKLVGRGKSSK